jgi:hypothetical protein
MKKIILFLILALPFMFISCDKKYTFDIYVQTTFDSEIWDLKTDELIIKAENDSKAYDAAYIKFMSLMNAKYIKNKKSEPELYFFQLISPEGKDISSGLILNNPNKVVNHFWSSSRASAPSWENDFKVYIENLPNEKLYLWISKGYIINGGS